MNINFELYRNFYIVANCNTITEAAKKLNVSQPALTKSIHNLESQLNGTLFIRSKKGIILTEEGKKFYNFISPAIEQIIEAETMYTNIGKVEIGNIKIGTSNTILKYFLLDHLKTYTSLFPKINITIEESYTPNLINMVKNGAIDIAIIYANDNDEKLSSLKIYNLKKLHYCLIGNKKYKKYSNQKISFSDLKDEKFILNIINPIQTSLINESNINITRNANINLASHSLVYEFVKEGFGIGVVIKEFIEDDLEKSNLFEIKLKEDFFPLNLIMVTNTNIFPSYATSQLIKIITKNNS